MSMISTLFPTRSQLRLATLLSALLLLQIVVTVVVFMPRGSAAFVPQRLIAAMQDTAVAELHIEDMQGTVIHLDRMGEAEWVIPEADGFPALEILADQLVEDMVELDNARPVTQTAASHERLRVAPDNFERRVTATLEDGSEVVLYVGTAPLPRATHVRVDGDDNIFISTDLKHREVSTQIARWVDTVYYSVNQDKVRKFALTNGNGTFEFVRDENDEWQMQGLAEEEQFNPNNLISLVTTISTMSLTQPLGNQAKPEYGLLLPQASVLLEIQDDDATSEVTILIGADASTANRVILKSSESPWFVEANRFTVDRLIERTREDFLAKPPEEPTPDTTMPDAVPE